MQSLLNASGIWPPSRVGPGALCSGILVLKMNSSWAHLSGVYATSVGHMVLLYLKGAKTLAFKRSMKDGAGLSGFDEGLGSLLYGPKESTLYSERTPTAV